MEHFPGSRTASNVLTRNSGLFVCVCVCMCVCACVHVSLCVHMCVYVYAYVHMYTYSTYVCVDMLTDSFSSARVNLYIRLCVYDPMY